MESISHDRNIIDWSCTLLALGISVLKQSHRVDDNLAIVPRGPHTARHVTLILRHDGRALRGKKVLAFSDTLLASGVATVSELEFTSL